MLVGGAVLAAVLVLLCLETFQLLRVRRENAALRAVTANLDQLREDNEELQRLRATAQLSARAQNEQEELARLRTEVTKLNAAAQELAVLRGESQRLAAERAAMAAKAGVAAEEDPFAESKRRAQRINCINNIKQIGLAARMWENDHKAGMPSDFLTMSNELSTPKILTCAADTTRTKAQSWQAFDGSSVSYELLSPGADIQDPWVVYVRCPLCNNVGLTDGSAQQLGPSQRVEKVDGKFKLVRVNTQPDPAKP